MRRAALLSRAFCTYGALSCELAFLHSFAICLTLVDQSGYSSLRLGKFTLVYRTGATVASSPSVSSFSHLSVLFCAVDMESPSPSGPGPAAGPGGWPGPAQAPPTPPGPGWNLRSLMLSEKGMRCRGLKLLLMQAPAPGFIWDEGNCWLGSTSPFTIGIRGNIPFPGADGG